MKTLGTGSYTKYLYPILTLLVSFAAMIPILEVGPSLDPDVGRIDGIIQHQIIGPDTCFKSPWPPGQPTWALVTGFIAGNLKALPHSSLLRILSTLSVFFGLFVAAVTFYKIRKLCKNDLLAFFATVSVCIHPMFIWHSVVVVEDMFGFFFFALAWLMAERPSLRTLAVICYSIGVAARLNVLGLLPLLLLEWVTEDHLKNPKRLISELAIPSLAILILVFMFFLPVFAFFGMDISKWNESIASVRRFMGVESLRTRIMVGWFYFRTTIIWWMPVGIAILYQNIRIYRKTRSLQSLIQVDIGIAAIVFLCLLLNPIGVLSIGIVALALGALGYFFLRKIEFRSFKTLEGTMVALSIIMSLSFNFLAPYSRNYILYALLPIAIALLYRFKTAPVWVAIALFSFAPNLKYFQITRKGVLIHPRGYYQAFQQHRVEEFNNYGFYSLQEATVIRFPWSNDNEVGP